MSRTQATAATVTIPGSLVQAYTQDQDPAGFERRVLEALVVDAVRRGLISRGKGGAILGLSFGEREQFFADRGVVYDFTPEEVMADLVSLRKGLGKPC